MNFHDVLFGIAIGATIVLLHHYISGRIAKKKLANKECGATKVNTFTYDDGSTRTVKFVCREKGDHVQHMAAKGNDRAVWSKNF